MRRISIPDSTAGFGLLRAMAMLALVAATGSATAFDRDGNFAVWGVGAKACHNFNQAGTGDGTYREFVMGYLTAYNATAADTYRIEGSMDLDQIMDWLGAYCEQQPMHSFEQALGEFTSEHADTRQTRPPTAFGR